MANIGEVLSSLKQAVREIGGAADQNTAPDNWGPAPSNKQLLLQIAALHKGLLALSDAFLENIEVARRQSASWDSSLEALRCELLGKLDPAQALQRDLQHMLTLEAGLTAQNAQLTDRVSRLEDAAASLQAAVEQQAAEAGQAIRNEVTQAANAHWEEHLQLFQQERLQPLAAEALQQQAGQWAATELTGLVQAEVKRQVEAALQGQLQAMQQGVDAAKEATASAAELASQAAMDAASLAGEVQQLTAWCQRVDEAHANHEQRLRLLEAECAEAAAAARPPAEDAGPAAAALALALQLERVAGALQEQEERVRRLEAAQAGAVGSRGGAASPGSSPAARTAGAAGTTAGPPQAQLAAALSRLVQAEARLQQLEALAADVGEQQAEQAEGLRELAAQQAQRGRSGDAHLHAMLTDVTALARHTKALDAEVRALRGGVGQVQEALLSSSSAFAKALNMPSPIGPFTTFPPL